MGKLKTHKGMKKVLNVRKSGSITIGHPGTRHNTGSKNAASNRKGRKGSQLSSGDYKRIKGILGK